MKNSWILPLACGFGCLFLPVRGFGQDIHFSDFESADFKKWKITGTAFGSQPAGGTLPDQQPVTGFQGGFASSYHGADQATGKMISPNFRIDRKFISFLIGGGSDSRKTHLDLIVDGKIVRSASGADDEKLAPLGWDVSDLRGKNAHLEIVDDADGGWGHISVDQIVFTDSKVPVVMTDASREVLVSGKWMSLPVKNGAAKRTVTIKADGREQRQFTIELADGEPDWWAPLDVSAWRGKKVTVTVDKLSDSSNALKNITIGETVPGTDSLYQEVLRPQIHFSSRRGWLNDPNGLVYYQGFYHLFYQHNPYGAEWGNMHWGHAVSKDLVHWQEVGEALYPDALGTMFSGSAIVDVNNSSGLGTAKIPPMVLFYTAEGKPFVQCLASTTDAINFTKYSKNPVVRNVFDDNRDPKVFWYEPTKNWMLTFWGKEDGRHVNYLFTSKNLRDWTRVGAIKGGADGSSSFLFECPDFFELPLDGKADQKKWVAGGANGEYEVGKFDGRNFVPETGPLNGQIGGTSYAAQTFNNEPSGRRIRIGWLRAVSPGMPFNNAMSIPIELGLVSTPEGPRMTFSPVAELETLRAKAHHLGSLKVSPGDSNPLRDVRGELLEIRAEFEPQSSSVVTFDVRGVPVVFDTAKSEISVEGRVGRVPLIDGKQRVTIFVDRTVIEIFAGSGRIYIPVDKVLALDNLSVGVTVSGAPVTFNSLDVYELKSAWSK